jgi:SAM-dependent methyltransferase
VKIFQDLTGDIPATRDYTESHTAPRKGEEYDREAASGATAFYWHNFERRQLEAIFSRLREEGRSRMLDFACGTGRILDVAAPFFPDCVGIDVSDSMLERARKKVPGARLIRANITRDKIDIGTFDVITLFRFVLNADPELRNDVLGWLHGVMRPGGALVLNNHRSATSIRGFLYRGVYAVGRRNRKHVLHESDLARLLEENGFTIEDRLGSKCVASWRNHLLMPPRALRVVEQRLASLPQSHRLFENQLYVCRRVG